MSETFTTSQFHLRFFGTALTFCGDPHWFACNLGFFLRFLSLALLMLSCLCCCWLRLHHGKHGNINGDPDDQNGGLHKWQQPKKAHTQ